MKKIALISIAVIVAVSSAAFGQEMLSVRPYSGGGLAGRPTAVSPGSPAQGPSQPPEKSCRPNMPCPLPGMSNPNSPASPADSGFEPAESPGPIRVKSLKVRVEVVEGAAVADIDQVFHNPSWERMEGIYACPVPAGAVVSGFSIFMEGKEVAGMVVGAREGREEYETIVRQIKDPGLVEYSGADCRMIRARVFPIPGRSDFRVRLRYMYVPTMSSGALTVAYPFKVAKAAAPVTDAAFSARVVSEWPITKAVSGPVKLDISRKSGSEILAGFTKRNFVPDRNPELHCRQSFQAPAVAMRCFTEQSGESYFMAAIVAGNDKIAKPSIRFNGATVDDVFPDRLPAVEPRTRNLVFGRFRVSQAPGECVLNAVVDGRPCEMRFKVEFCRGGDENSFIPALWAREKVKALIDSQVRATSPDAHEAEIVKLAKKYGILTKHTCFLAK